MPSAPAVSLLGTERTALSEVGVGVRGREAESLDTLYFIHGAVAVRAAC